MDVKFEVPDKRVHDIPEYRVWAGIKARCLNPKEPAYKYYGGRGITVCKRWRNSFRAFYEDMGPRPGPTYSIDRQNNDGPYDPENCRWATIHQQRRNKSNNHWIRIGDKKRLLKDVAHDLGLTHSAIIRRKNAGWTDTEAATLAKNQRHDKLVEFDGRKQMLKVWAEEYGLPYTTLFSRLDRGWSLEDALKVRQGSRPPQTYKRRTDASLFTYNGKSQTLLEWTRELGFPKHLLRIRLWNGWTLERALLTPKEPRISRG